VALTTFFNSTRGLLIDGGMNAADVAEMMHAVERTYMVLRDYIE